MSEQPKQKIYKTNSKLNGNFSTSGQFDRLKRHVFLLKKSMKKFKKKVYYHGNEFWMIFMTKSQVSCYFLHYLRSLLYA